MVGDGAAVCRGPVVADAAVVSGVVGVAVGLGGGVRVCGRIAMATVAGKGPAGSPDRGRDIPETDACGYGRAGAVTVRIETATGRTAGHFGHWACLTGIYAADCCR